MTGAVTRAMLLAAGRGERLRPLTAQTPKPLVQVGGRPMVHYVLDRLAEAGVREVHVNTHHLWERLVTALGDGSAWGLSLCYHPEPTILGTGGGLLAVCRACPSLTARDFVMINSDILVDVDLGAVIAAHLARRPLATLVLREDPEAARYGVIGTDAEGRIRRFLEVDTGGATRACMFTGVQVLGPGILGYLEDAAARAPGGAFPVTDPYKAALKAGADLRACVHEGYWADLGTPERLSRAEADLAAGRAGLPAPPGTR
jgi:NDP-sugar pyrophosphorylase family protein